jgi:hypothetical protein
MKSNLKLFNEYMIKTNNPQAVGKSDYFIMWLLGRKFERKLLREPSSQEGSKEA